jgi:hypothetical protein
MNPDQTHLPAPEQTQTPQVRLQTFAGDDSGAGHFAVQPPRPASGAQGQAEVRLGDEEQVKERNRRFAILESFWELTRDNKPAEGAIGRVPMSRTKAAKQVGEDYTSLWRYEQLFRDGGKDGLLPKTAECGGKSVWEYLLKDEAFCLKLMGIYLATIGSSGGNVTRGRRTAKVATALTAMAEEPECPEPLAARLRRGKFPMCLQRHLKRITPEMENRARGAKHFQLNGVTSRRDLTLRFPNGDRAEMPAGFKWVFDDMSVNQPFWCEAAGKILFSRQGLYAIDQRSLKWLGKMLVARPREAYRAEDILRFLRGLFLAYGGKPDVIVFEQGIWRARKIHGFKMNEFGQPVGEDFERGEMQDGEKHLLTDGLAAIGIKVIFATSAHGKIIETCFNPLQTQIAIRTREFVNIGRHAGEFEIGGKRLARVRQAAGGQLLASGGERTASRTPSFLGFAPAHVLSERIDECLAFINAKENSRKETPDWIWERDIAGRPLQENQATDAAVFLPEIRERHIDGGRVTVTVNGQAHDFRAPWMIELGSGYKVFCRFDPAEPSRGAAIYNRESGAANFNGYKAGQFLGFVSWEMPAPSVDVTGDVRGVVASPAADFYGAGAVDNGDAIRKKQNKLVATFFSALPRPGQPAVKMNEIRDGEGRVARVERQAAAGNNEPLAPTLAPPAAAPVQRPGNILAQPTPDEFARKRARLAAAAGHTRSLQAANPNLVET